MSDILEKLLGVEKNAADLVSAAEAEATRRKTQARADAQKQHAALLKEKAESLSRTLAAEKDRLKAERAEKSRESRQKLLARPLDNKEFTRVALMCIEKGSR